MALANFLPTLTEACVVQGELLARCIGKVGKYRWAFRAPSWQFFHFRHIYIEKSQESSGPETLSTSGRGKNTYRGEDQLVSDSDRSQRNKK